MKVTRKKPGEGDEAVEGEGGDGADGDGAGDGGDGGGDADAPSPRRPKELPTDKVTESGLARRE